jgi:hypothetical protein
MADDRNVIQLGHVYLTTRRKYELMRINEVDHAIKATIKEVDEAIALVGNPGDAWIEDGEMEIEIRVKQRMKRKGHPFYRDTPGAGY